MEDPESSSPEEKHIIAFEENDPGNPYNWSSIKKIWIVFLGTILVFNSTLDSSLASGSSQSLQKHFNVTSDAQLVLPNSIFILGYVLGPCVWAPLSESLGRQIVFIGSFIPFTIFTLATCFSPNWAAFIVFRMLAGILASPAISVTGGLYADVFSNPVSRGRSVAWFMLIGSIGPAGGPIPGGLLADAFGWRPPYWFELGLAVVSLAFLAFLPETFGPEILRRRAKKIRKQNPGSNAWGQLDLQKRTVGDIVRNYLARPLKMLFTELIVSLTCIYLSIIYAIIFMFFQSYPIIFGDTYKFSEGQIALAFIPVVVGNFLGTPVYLWWDYYIRTARERGAAWPHKEEYKRLPLACISGPFFVIGLFWLGWTAKPDIHWIVPMLAGLPIGFGFVLVFVALINYLVDAYRIYAASALGAASMSRALFGVVLPFATKSMFSAMTVPWACSMLGFISLALCLIPFGFIRYGDRIRAGSKICQELNASEKQGSVSTETVASGEESTKSDVTSDEKANDNPDEEPDESPDRKETFPSCG